jgi:hypothetical protein
MVYSRCRTQTQFVVLTPGEDAVPGVFRNRIRDRHRHQDLMAAVQRFRGGIYANDGAVRHSDLTSDGRHNAPVDGRSWHVVSLDRDGRVCSCLRYLEERSASGFDDLWVRHAALARSNDAPRFRRAVEQELCRARQLGLGFGEVGGWAVGERHRWTLEPLRIILATYGLLQLLGGSVGVATATVRHRSSTILRRIGLRSLAPDGKELPTYYDPSHECDMELLGFDSRFPDARYRNMVEELGAALTAAPVICPEGN